MGNLQVNGGLTVMNSITTSNFIANGTMTAHCIELQPSNSVNHGGYIDFHYNGSNSDYTSRIIENESGALLINASNGLTVTGVLKFSQNLTNVSSPTTVATFIGNDSKNGIGYANTANLSVGYATIATQDGDGAVISSTYLKLAGGTMTGTIVTPGNDSVVIKPARNNYDQIGASDCKFWKIHATTFYGNLRGNADTATTASAVAWGNVTDKPSSFTPSSHSHSHIEYVDTRNINQSPNDLQAGLTIHLKANGADGLSDNGSYHAVVGIKDWNDYSGGPYGQLAITANHMWFRNSNSGTAWNYWRKILDSSNYTSYTVTKTGDGASGTWNINALKASQASSYLHAGASGYHLIKIKDLNGWMTAFTVRLYQAYRYTDIVISGYNYGANHWYSPAASMIGTSGTTPIEVQFGYDSSNYLWVAIPADNYYGIDIINTTNGYTQFNSYAGLFEISQVSSIPSTFQTSRMAYPPVLADYGTTLPAAGQAGRIFFKKVT